MSAWKDGRTLVNDARSFRTCPSEPLPNTKSLPTPGNAPPVVFLTGIDKAKFRKPVVPGDQLRLQVTVVKRRPPFWKMQGKAFVGNDLVCEAESTAMVTTTTEPESVSE